MDLEEFDGAVGFDQVAEHAAPAHREELTRIPDEDDAPPMAVGEASQLAAAAVGANGANQITMVSQEG